MKLHYINYSNKVVMYCNKLYIISRVTDIYFENNFENNVWTLEHNIEEL